MPSSYQGNDLAAHSPQVAAWATYDLANTAFALGVGGLYFAGG